MILDLAQVVEPVQLATIVLSRVEVHKPLVAELQLYIDSTA